MQRVLRYDGFLPNVLENGKTRMEPPRPDELREMGEWIEANRSASTSFDIVIEGQTPGEDRTRAQKTIQPYREAGATWWLEAAWEAQDLEQVLTRIRLGPPG